MTPIAQIILAILGGFEFGYRFIIVIFAMILIFPVVLELIDFKTFLVPYAWQMLDRQFK